MIRLLTLSALLLCADFLTAQPLNDIVPRKTQLEKRVLQPQFLREADVFWSKRVWRVIDVREKQNLPFVYPQAPLYELLKTAIERNQLDAYATSDADFIDPLRGEALSRLFGTVDTVPIFDPNDYSESLRIVENEFGYEDIQRFRLEEVWFIDRRTSTLQVRILAISPLRDKKDDNGNFLYELPMFRVYFPDARALLARVPVFVPGNDSAAYSWDDLFQQRRFSSYVYKGSNIRDERLGDVYSGRDLLREAQQLETAIFNREQDLWSY